MYSVRIIFRIIIHIKKRGYEYMMMMMGIILWFKVWCQFIKESMPLELAHYRYHLDHAT